MMSISTTKPLMASSQNDLMSTRLLIEDFVRLYLPILDGGGLIPINHPLRKEELDMGETVKRKPLVVRK
jgi:hypothetical protein